MPIPLAKLSALVKQLSDQGFSLADFKRFFLGAFDRMEERGLFLALLGEVGMRVRYSERTMHRGSRYRGGLGGTYAA